MTDEPDDGDPGPFLAALTFLLFLAGLGVYLACAVLASRN